MKRYLKLFLNFVPFTCLSVVGCQQQIINPQLNQIFDVKWHYQVVDGDTLYFTNDTIKQGVRFFGIDTPEIFKGKNNQHLALLENYYGQKAKSYLFNLTYQKNIKIKYITKDKYNRWICKVYSEEGEDLAFELVKQGLARVSYISIDHHAKYYWVNNKEQKEYFWKLNQLQNEAQQNKRGFWKEKNINLVFNKH